MRWLTSICLFNSRRSRRSHQPRESLLLPYVHGQRWASQVYDEDDGGYLSYATETSSRAYGEDSDVYPDRAGEAPTPVCDDDYSRPPTCTRRVTSSLHSTARGGHTGPSTRRTSQIGRTAFSDSVDSTESKSDDILLKQVSSSTTKNETLCTVCMEWKSGNNSSLPSVISTPDEVRKLRVKRKSEKGNPTTKPKEERWSVKSSRRRKKPRKFVQSLSTIPEEVSEDDKDSG